MLKTLILALMVAVFTVPAQAEPPHVVTDIAPVHSLVSMVMLGVGVPDTILPPGASPHHYSMRPSEAAALARADLVFWVGEALTPWLDTPITTLATGAKRVTLTDVFGVKLITSSDMSGPEILDPHLWLSPENAIAWIHEISRQLSAADPENATIYDANTTRALAQIAQMKVEVAAILSPSKGLKYLTFHDGYGYFEQAFLMPATQHIIDLDEAPPSPRHIAFLSQWVAENDITCMLAGPEASPGLIANVFGTHAFYAAKVDPMGTEFPPGPQLYPRLIRSIAEALAACPK